MSVATATPSPSSSTESEVAVESELPRRGVNSRGVADTGKGADVADDRRSCTWCGNGLALDAHANARYCTARCRRQAGYEKQRQRPIKVDEHGTLTGYTRGCRCAHCRACNAAYSRRYRAEHPAPPAPPRIRKGVRLGRRNPDEHGTPSAYVYGCRCAGCRRSIAAHTKKWRLRNPDKFTANQRRYRQRNPDKVRGTSAQRAAAPFDDEAQAYAEIIKGDPCSYCGHPSDTIDHITALTSWPTSAWTNLTAACRSCNSAKGTKSLLAFLLYQTVKASAE